MITRVTRRELKTAYIGKSGGMSEQSVERERRVARESSG